MGDHLARRVQVAIGSALSRSSTHRSMAASKMLRQLSRNEERPCSADSRVMSSTACFVGGSRGWRPLRRYLPLGRWCER